MELVPSDRERGLQTPVWKNYQSILSGAHGTVSLGPSPGMLCASLEAGGKQDSTPQSCEPLPACHEKCLWGCGCPTSLPQSSPVSALARPGLSKWGQRKQGIPSPHFVVRGLARCMCHPPPCRETGLFSQNHPFTSGGDAWGSCPG